METDISRKSADVALPVSLTVKSRLEYAKAILITVAIALSLKVFVVDAYRIPTSSMENTLSVGDYLLVNKLAYGLRTPRHVPFFSARIPSFALPLFSRVKRGDVVVFEYPASSEEISAHEPTYYVKRCVGLPGDIVEIRGGQVFVNQNLMEFPRTAIADAGHGGTQTFVVPQKGQRIQLNLDNLALWKSLILKEGHSVEAEQLPNILIDGYTRADYVVQQDYYFVMGDNMRNSSDSRTWGFVPDENLVGEALLIYWSWDPDVASNSAGDKWRSVRWERIGRIIR
jgi:signal peptidase I